jgi:DNA-binding NarL/FixJ family response regulator
MQRLNQLTAREREILALVANGCENKEIACRLHLSVFTVQTHLRNLFECLGVQNRTQAATLYWRHATQAGPGQDTFQET